jgi:hypothetical protein
MQKIAAVVLWLACSSAFGQIDLTADVAKAVTGLESPRIVGDVILVGGESKPIIEPVAIVTVKTAYKFFDVVAQKSLFEEAVLVRLSDTEFLLQGEGRWVIKVTAFDPEKGIAKKSAEVVIGKSTKPPDPIDPPVDPPVGFEQIAELAKTKANLANDPSTKAALAASIIMATAVVSPDDSLDHAKGVVVAAIESTLGRRTGSSRLVDWLSIWRKPVNDAVLAAKIETTANYLACMKAIAEAMK